jgi:hypothetical protein
LNEIQTPSTHLEALFEILVLFEELSIVDNGLRVGDLEVHHLVINDLGCLDRADGFLQVNVERPQLKRLE